MRNLVHIWLFYYSRVIEGKSIFCQHIDLIRCLNYSTFQFIIIYWNVFHCQDFIALSLSLAWVLSGHSRDYLNWMRHIDWQNKSLENWWQMGWDVYNSAKCPIGEKNIKHFQLVTIFEAIYWILQSLPTLWKSKLKLPSRPSIW